MRSAFSRAIAGSFVQCDGYDAYDKLTRVDRSEGPWTLVHCWPHARRRFVKRLEKDGSPIAEEALRQIAELYAIEKNGLWIGTGSAACREARALCADHRGLPPLACSTTLAHPEVLQDWPKTFDIPWRIGLV